MDRVQGDIVFNDYPKGKYARKVDWWYTTDGLDLIKGWRMQGLSIKDIAEKMDIDLRTLNAWRKKYPKFDEVLYIGKEVTIKRVEQSLYNRACGYDYEEVTKELVEGEMRVTKVVTKHCPADVKAALNFLYNRDPQHWRFMQEPLESTQYTETIKNILISMKEVAESGKEKTVDVVEVIND